ncbi:hypothetical protein QQX98_009768 [Neonectria punicea]|uniref:Uncharacterized protein n=1 Tax=Neonectria punicea TaxID=979145 RepID=A0ABR1GRP1_9HYPO
MNRKRRLQDDSLLGRPPLRHVFRFWSFEIPSLILAVGLLVVIVTILAAHHGQKLPDWPYKLNLNTIIALLSTVFRATIVMILAEMIGQSKWTWFKDGARPLSHLQAFDEASRSSILGSLNLVAMLRFGFRGNPLAMTAALATVLSLAVGPFTQQAIRTVPCPQTVSGLNATIPVANSVSGEDTFFQYSAGYFELGAGLKGAMINGLTDSHGNDSAIQATCPTGNCTFPEFAKISHSTIGMCSKCMDTTESVSVTFRDAVNNEGIMNVTVNDLWVGAGNFNPALAVGTGNRSFAESIMDLDFRDIAYDSIVNVTVLTYSRTPCTAKGSCPFNVTLPKEPANQYYVATSCALYPCMKNIAASVKSGKLEEKVLTTVPARRDSLFSSTVGSLYAPREVVKSPCVIGEQVLRCGQLFTGPQYHG